MTKQAVFHSAGDDMPMSNMASSCSPSVGLQLTGLQYLHLPSFKTEERTQSEQQRHQWLNGWGDLMHLNQGLGGTSHNGQQMAGRTW